MTNPRASTRLVTVLGVVLLVCLLHEGAARAQCPSRWDPVETKGMSFWVNVQGGIGLLWGKHHEDVLGMGSYLGTLGLDARARFGMFHTGVTGQFGFGADKTYFQMVDVHLGVDIVRVYQAYYKYILSRNVLATYYGYNYRAQLVHTRYCNQTQRLGRHFIFTAGPKLIFTERGQGMGAHATFRYMRFLSRSQHGFWADAVFHYGALTAFKDHLRPDAPVLHSFGGEGRFGYFLSYFNTSLSLGYFASSWQFMYNIGFNIMGW